LKICDIWHLMIISYPPTCLVIAAQGLDASFSTVDQVPLKYIQPFKLLQARYSPLARLVLFSLLPHPLQLTKTCCSS
jgi:hypothetical protein